jgi:hypothetical protein
VYHLLEEILEVVGLECLVVLLLRGGHWEFSSGEDIQNKQG